MRVACFTSGGTFGCQAVEALAADHDVVAVVRPIIKTSMPRRLLGRAARAVGLRPEDPVDVWTSRTRTPVLRARRGDDERIVTALTQIKPDLVCIATFPWVLDPALLGLPRHGAINVHPSLLPRHRGANPYFWTYYHDDRETGVSVHDATAHADAGSLLEQDHFALPRGQPIEALYAETARRGATMLRSVAAAIERGVVRRTPQDERLATRAPRLAPGTPMVPFDAWEVERVWHFLAGLNPKYREPLRDAHGRAIRYRRVTGFQESSHRDCPGTVTDAGAGWSVACRGGHVYLGRQT